MYTSAETHIPVYSLTESSFENKSDFEITQCRALSSQQRQLFFVPHRNDYYKLIFVRNGNSRHWVDMQPFTVKPHSFYFSGPDQVILKEDSLPNDVISICFTQDFLGMEENRVLRGLPIIKNPHGGHELLLSQDDVAFVEDLSAKIITEYTRQEDWRNSMLLGYLQVLLIYLSRLYTSQYTEAGTPPDRNLLKRFNVLLTDNFRHHHHVAAYASMLNLSAGHFSEVIKEQSGKTAIQHIHDCLLLEAKRLLFHTDSSVKEIAFELGFEDASYFNRFFKRLTASTPAEYRIAIREMYH